MISFVQDLTFSKITKKLGKIPMISQLSQRKEEKSERKALTNKPYFRYTALMFRFSFFLFFLSILVSACVWSQYAFVRVGNPRKIDYYRGRDYGVQQTGKQETNYILIIRCSPWNHTFIVLLNTLLEHFVKLRRKTFYTPTKVYPCSELKGSSDRNTNRKFIELNLEIRS